MLLEQDRGRLLAVASYFSYDNGVTNLGDWEAGAVADNGCSFVNGTGGALWDPYCTQQNGAGTAQVLTALDKQYLECIGYHIA
jgi:hypothetical protein